MLRLPSLHFFSLACVFAVLTAPVITTAAQSSRDQSALRHWQIRDGLPENNVQALAETADGFLWIGTSGGLVRFDGREFQTYDHSNTPAFEESSITALLAAGEDLWIGTDGGGLILKRGKSMLPYPLTAKAKTSVRFLYRGQGSRLFAVTDEGTFSWIDGEGKPTQRVTTETQPARRGVEAGKATPAGAAAVRQTVTEVLERSSPAASVKTSDGTQWKGTEFGLFHRGPNDSTFHRFACPRSAINTLLPGSDGRLWVGTVHDGLFWVRDGACTAVEQFEQHRALSIQALLEDENQSIWVGTQAGVFQLIPSTTHLVRLPNGFPSEFGTLALDLDGSVLVAARRLYRVVDRALVPVALPELGNAEVRNAVRDLHGNLWIGTVRDGVFRFGAHSLLHLTTQDGLANNSIRVMSVAPDGSLWIGTDNGVSQWRNGRVVTYGVADGLADGFVQAVVSGARGDIWIGTAHGLSHLLGGMFQQEEIVRRLSQERVWSIFAAPQGDVWIGTRSGGLYCLHDQQVLHFSTAQGLGSNSIYKILGSARDALWLSGPGGVSVVSQRELLQASSGKEISPVFFDISDGQETPNFYGGVQASGVMAADGDVWFPTDHGPVHIPAQARISRRLRLQIKNLEVDGKRVPETSTLVLEPGESNLQVHYGAILLSPQSGVRYRYRLDDVDKQWTYANGRTTAYFTNLPAGDFRFRVQVYDTRSPNDIVETVLSIHKEPRFFRRAWFLGGCAALFAIGLWTAHGLRVRSAHERLEAVYAERMRLSREVHDTVLQGCAGVSTLLEACSGTPAEHEQREMLLNHARAQIVSTMEDARQAIQRFRGSGAPDLDVSSALREMLERMQREFQRRVEYIYRGNTIFLPPAMMHEVEMVAREAIYNAMVHSGGTRVQLTACGCRRELQIDIADNGCGLVLGSAAKAGHYGLTGMRERIVMMQGDFELRPVSPHGTVVHFRVPLAHGRIRNEA